MGPLVPFGIIGSEFNYLIAALIGFAFGYILERAGFSTSRKLVGVFYGYDFVVLRVFFTAAATAMTGLIVLDYLGFIDFSFIYINPLFTWPMIVGGIIMGFGFILGGFCPGTSMAAAAIGKIDAMVFLLGSFIGIFFFGEIFSGIKDFYLSGSMGPIFVYDSLGISRSLFAAILGVISIVSFIVTSVIEKKVSYGIEPNHPKYKMAIPAITIGFAAAIIILILPDEREGLIDKPADQIAAEYSDDLRYISPEEAAYEIYYNTGKFNFIDVRSPEEYKKMCMPKAFNIETQNMQNKANSAYLNQPGKTAVFYSKNEDEAAKAFIIAQKEGFSNIAILKDGFSNFADKYITGKAKIGRAAFIGGNTENFQDKVISLFKSDSTLTKPRKKKEIVVKAVKVQGGC